MCLPIRAVMLVVALVACACNSVSNTGLGASNDAGTSGTPICSSSVTNLASWPANTGYTTCTKSCGPDDIGYKTCGQTDLATCQASSGCVCVTSPCVKCADCAFLTLPDCYVPSNAANPSTCASTVTNGGSCAPACGKTLCIEADGKTGCVCNSHGRYACATWSSGAWK